MNGTAGIPRAFAPGRKSKQILIQPTAEERAVARIALVSAVVDHHVAAGQGGHHPAVISMPSYAE